MFLLISVLLSPSSSRQSSADGLNMLQESKNELKVSLGITKIRSLLSFFVFHGQACVYLLLLVPSTIY